MGKQHNITLSARLNLWILSLGSLVFISVLSVNYFASRQLLQEYVEELTRSTIGSAVKDIESVLDTVSNSADSLAALVKANDIDEQATLNNIMAIVRSNRDVYGMTVALEPGVIDGAVAGFAPYFFRQGDDLGYADLSDGDYGYRDRDWYKTPYESGQASWSEPYFDDGGGEILMTTYSTPVRDRGEVVGIATADLGLAWLHELISDIRIGETGYGFIVSEQDIVISHPNAAFNMEQLADTLDDRVIPANWQRYLESKQTDETVYIYTPCRHTEGHCWVAIESLADTGWKIFIVLPEAEMIADIRSLTVLNTSIAITGLILLLFVITIVTHRLTKPLSSLASATRDIGGGNLETALPETGHGDEISALSRDFNSMRLALRDHIERVREATASKQKLESEIEIARDIQMSMIPGAGNVSLRQPPVELFAFLRPAKSVGGDLYYYTMSDNRLRFMVGDVSDKGVPAAIFMAKTVTLYTRALRDDLSPGETFTMMNEILADNNDACMFVTALCGDLDLESKQLVMTNAGHMNPIRYLAGSTDELEVDGATALGLMTGTRYDDVKTDLAEGTRLVMYTDGVSEAKAADDEEFGEDRLIKQLSRLADTGIESVGRTIIDEVDRFADDREQFDDITLFIISVD